MLAEVHKGYDLDLEMLRQRERTERGFRAQAKLFSNFESELIRLRLESPPERHLLSLLSWLYAVRSIASMASIASRFFSLGSARKRASAAASGSCLFLLPGTFTK